MDVEEFSVNQNQLNERFKNVKLKQQTQNEFRLVSS